MKNTINYYIIFFLIFFSSIIHAQTLNEIERLKSEYERALNRQSLQKSSEVTDAEKRANSTALPNKLVYSRKDIESLLINTQKLIDELNSLEDSTRKLNYAGYNFFTRRDSIPFWQNMPIPKNYKLGPGDEVIISLWGEVESYNSETINRDGQIFIKDIGIINLSGKSLLDAKNYILSIFSKKYSTLVGSNPKSYIDISLGELKALNVHFLGAVNIPGVHIIHPFSNVISGLIQSGGVDNSGSLREIKILRNGKIINVVDIYEYIFSGNSFMNIKLMDQDIVFVPPRLSTIAISGRVKKPGYYELLKNETISDLINYSSGFESRASQTIYLQRYDNLNSKSLLINLNNNSKLNLFNGDSLHVPILKSEDKYIFVDGHIKNPGKYPFQDGMHLDRLLELTLSTDSDFIKTLNYSKAIIYRKNPNDINPIRKEVNMLDGKKIVLKSGDHVTFLNNEKYEKIQFVRITGEVKIPGSYPVNKLTKLNEIIKMAGGFTEDALENGIEIFRDTLKIRWDEKSFVLDDRDSINVLKKTGLILVTGEVNSPGYYNFNKNLSIKSTLLKPVGTELMQN